MMGLNRVGNQFQVTQVTKYHKRESHEDRNLMSIWPLGVQQIVIKIYCTVDNGTNYGKPEKLFWLHQWLSALSISWYNSLH